MTPMELLTNVSDWLPFAYLLGLPIVDYSLDIGKEHVNLINDKLEKLEKADFI